MNTNTKFKELERALKALANKRRLEIIRFIKTRKEAVVGDIASEIRLSFKSTSKHLGVLAGADILEREQKSVRGFYRLSSDMPRVARQIISDL